MYTREQYIQSIQYEGRVIVHLYSKVKPEMLNYRPSPAQRSMQELLEYLPLLAAPIARMLANGDWSSYQEIADGVKAAVKKDFPKAMEQSINEFADLVMSTSDHDLLKKDVGTPIGITCKLGEAFVNWNLKFLAAYRMQLFLYLKSCGQPELGTHNLWMGMDAPPKA